MLLSQRRELQLNSRIKSVNKIILLPFSYTNPKKKVISMRKVSKFCYPHQLWFLKDYSLTFCSLHFICSLNVREWCQKKGFLKWRMKWINTWKTLQKLQKLAKTTLTSPLRFFWYILPKMKKKRMKWTITLSKKKSSYNQ